MPIVGVWPARLVGATAVPRPKLRRDPPIGAAVLVLIPVVPPTRAERLVPAGLPKREKRDGLRVVAVVVVGVVAGYRRDLRPNAIASY
jgi:hypothetical protein